MSAPEEETDDPNSVYDRWACHFCESSIRRQAN